MYLNLLVYHRNISGSSLKVFGNFRKSSDIFGNFRKFTENVRERLSGLRNNFGKSSEIFGKLSKTPSSVSLYNKQNNTWTLGDMEFIFSCSHLIPHSFAALTRSISMWTLEDKFHISAPPCIILYIFLQQLLLVLIGTPNCYVHCTNYSRSLYLRLIAHQAITSFWKKDPLQFSSQLRSYCLFCCKHTALEIFVLKVNDYCISLIMYHLQLNPLSYTDLPPTCHSISEFTKTN